MERELVLSGFNTPEQTLDWHVQDASDSFDANYREDCIDAIKSYHLQFHRGLIQIPDEYKMPNDVQKCIDHIMKKAQAIDGSEPYNVSKKMILKTVAQELQQYL